MTPTPPPVEQESSASPGAEDVRVLVAEDESLIRMDLVEILRDAGYRVVASVGDGESALDEARKQHPDVALLDISMPGMDGLAVASILSAERVCAVVLVTAYSQREIVSRAAASGALAYVVKPFSPADLVPAIELARSRFEELEALHGDVGELRSKLEDRRVLERAKGSLMAAYGLSESEAWRLLQKQAMDQRTSMAAVARRVLTRSEPVTED